MKGKIIKYLLYKLAGKERNGFFLWDGLVIVTKIEHISFNVKNNPLISVLDTITINEIRTLDIVANPYETDFIII